MALNACESKQTRALGVLFLSLFSCNFDDQLSPNSHRFVILLLCIGKGPTPIEYWSLTITKRIHPLKGNYMFGNQS